ncbi:hypothetical protein CONCODRAFT_17497 [Conidiobolus coronatus NRRL 28638]|uniref:F-box domain-containing protein n=1 Tax=Conidiobolus coronatus (strain ATCC 28846 / CBS 209.66 / NRRL 28638) TaxID=796925 RepID=A0A137P6C2_CONC2|nr:hypothetical protein CONCODRAFT_17497 [Conidiobolus coronatus NRRL 28638]|eukprot:KXN70573.1 hypothetical protein CONCODRAFT_17497 [Conidiobolus coronatus NRRL 28638]
MEIKLKLKINWLNIIFSKDFLDYLELETLKEVSLTSKLVREKINPRLFKKVMLSSNIFEFEFKDNIFIECINQYLYPESYNGTSIDGYNHLNSLSVENGLNDYICTLNDIKKFVKSLYYEDAKKSEYYLFPIVNIFDNLTFLRLDCCIVPFAAFYKLDETLVSLKNLEINHVTLYKLPDDNINSDQITLPSNLSCLDFRYCMLASSKLLFDPYKFILNQNLHDNCGKFNLPVISLPSLKKLAYFNYEDVYEEVESFLAINPNLESLIIESFDLNLIKELNSLKCLELDTISQLNTDSQIPSLEYIERLSVNIVNPECYEKIKLLCLLCLNLEYLSFYMGDSEYVKDSIDNFLLPLASSLPLLKTLKLVFGSSKDDLDFSMFTNIESLIIDTESFTILDLNFETCAKLKKIEFISYLGEVNTQEFKDKFDSYKNWIFKFYSNTIKGYRINY